MKIFIFTFAMILSFQAFTQEISPYKMFDPQKSCFLMASDVSLRSKPDSKSKAVAKLAIGSELNIVNITEKELIINGISAPWFEVSINGKTGYIWSGHLSLSDMKSADGTRFLVGMSKVKSENSITMQVKVCKNNKEMQKLEFEGGSLNSTRTGVVLSNNGVSNVVSVLDIEYSDDFCGNASGNHIFFWDGKKLHFVKHLVSESDMFCISSENFIYPNDEGGKAGTILMQIKTSCHQNELYNNQENEENVPENEENVVKDYEVLSIEEYIWKNNNLVFVKKYDIK